MIPPVEVDIVIHAPPPTVYAILRDPDGFARWMGAAAGSFEHAPGSAFHLEFPQYGMAIAGEVVEFRENERVAVTWGAVGGPQAETMPEGSTLVDIQLEEVDGGTRVLLRHSGFSTEQLGREHDSGWRFHTSRLALFADRDHLRTVLGGLLATYDAAWREADEAVRAGLLEQVCADDVAFSDEYAAFQGRSALSLHIGNCQRFMPGATLSREGDPWICRGHVLSAWQLSGADGSALGEGYDVIRLTPGDRMASVNGFWSEARVSLNPRD